MQELININQLEFLTKLGAEETTIEILGTKFTFRTLNVEENTQAFETPTKEKYEDNLAKFNAMKVEVLCRAIVKINDLEIPDEMRPKIKTLLKKSQQVAINRMFEAYQSLVVGQDSKIEHTEDAIKNEMVNPNLVPPKDASHTQESPQNVAHIPQRKPSAPRPVNIVDPDQLVGPQE